MRYIFWAGDSTAKHNRISSYPFTGIGQVFNLYLKETVDVKNFAEDGRSTKSFIDEGRLDKIYKQISKDDFLFIQFGHNDQKEDDSKYTEPFGSYQDYLAEFVQVAQSKGAYPVLITPLTRRFFDQNGSINDHSHGKYPDAMKALANRLKVPYIDLTEKSLELIRKTGDLDSIKWFAHLKPNEAKDFPHGLIDNTHLRHEGAVVMAGLIAKGLKEIGSPYMDLLLDEI